MPKRGELRAMTREDAGPDQTFGRGGASQEGLGKAKRREEALCPEVVYLGKVDEDLGIDRESQNTGNAKMKGYIT